MVFGPTASCRDPGAGLDAALGDPPMDIPCPSNVPFKQKKPEGYLKGLRCRGPIYPLRVPGRGRDVFRYPFVYIYIYIIYTYIQVHLRIYIYMCLYKYLYALKLYKKSESVFAARRLVSVCVYLCLRLGGNTGKLRNYAGNQKLSSSRGGWQAGILTCFRLFRPVIVPYTQVLVLGSYHILRLARCPCEFPLEARTQTQTRFKLWHPFFLRSKESMFGIIREIRNRQLR